MFNHNNYLNLREKVLGKIDKEQTIINQTIHIQDIFIYHSEFYEKSKGEAKEKNNIHTNKYPDLIRLTDHVEFLIDIANEYHKEYYCDKNADDDAYTIRADCLNKITRLSLSEFSLYTETPISQDDFLSLFNEINEVAKRKKSLSNVHVLLSSFAVLGMNNRLLNVSLYLQCGEEAKVDIICKAITSAIDPVYPGTINFTQIPGHTNEFVSTVSYDHNHKINHDMIVPNKPFMLIETKGGAKYTQIIDICIDHLMGHPKGTFKKQIRSGIMNNPFISPKQVDQLVTSNCCPTLVTSMIAEMCFNINPLRYMPTAIKKNDLVKPVNFVNHPIMKLYPEMSMHKLKDGLAVSHPPFGWPYIIVATQERELCGFASDLKDTIELRNKKAKECRLMLALEHTAPFFDYHANDVVQKLHQLHQALANACAPSAIEGLFKNESYQLKLNAYVIINQSFDDIMAIFKKESKCFVFDQVKIMLGDLRMKLKEAGKQHGAFDTLGTLTAILDRGAQGVEIVKLRL